MGVQGTHTGHTGIHRPARWRARYGSHLQGHAAQEGPRTQLPQQGPTMNPRAHTSQPPFLTQGRPASHPQGPQRQPALPTLSAPSAASRELREPARGFTIRPAPGADIGSGAALSLLAPCQGRACPRTSGCAPGRPIRPFPRRMTGDGTLLGPPCQPQRTGCPGDACTQRATTHAAPSAQTCGHLLLLGHRTTAPETQCHSRGKPRVSAHTPRARGVFTTSNTG